ncbi:glycosyl hydrolase family 28-related protein [Streptomyces triticirhizae]|nr:glycosyl hydrolase family 28-related protein [Streptomyces triticirhizae]
MTPTAPRRAPRRPSRRVLTLLGAAALAPTLALTLWQPAGSAAPPEETTPAAHGMIPVADAFRSGGAQPGQDALALTGFAAEGARAVFTVAGAEEGASGLTVHYRTQGEETATVTLLANGTEVERLALPGTAGAWDTLETGVPLRAGLNTVTLRTASGDNGAFELSGITVADAAPAPTRGAALPYTAYEAEAGTTDGTVIGPDRTYLTVPSEASGRQAVVLEETGSHVEFELTEPANALTLRHSIPDSADGTGIDATLSLYVNGEHHRDLELTSRHAWVYGEYPYTNNPAEGSPHRFFDESRVLLDEELPAGTVLRLQKDAEDTADSYTVDLLEAETAPGPGTMPDGFVDATERGVTPDDGSDDTAALNEALAQTSSEGLGLWLPPGDYHISDHVNLTGATLRGAGEWHTVLRGSDGLGGFFGRGGTSVVQDLTLDGGATVRDDAGDHAAFEGDFGSGSTLQNIWIEHSKVGLWIQSPTDGLLATGLRIRDTYADGVNLHRGTANTEVTHSSIRNTGDDGLAMWSESEAVSDSAFRFNTVQVPLLANAVGIYGGHANGVEDNVLADTVTSSAGIAISTRFSPVPFSGTTSVRRNTLLRTGGYEPNWDSAFGALWIYADTSDITAPVVVNDLEIVDSTYSGILVSWQRTVTELSVSDVEITGTGRFGIEINAAGSGTFSGVRVSGAAEGGLDLTGGFTVERGEGNSGW